MQLILGCLFFFLTGFSDGIQTHRLDAYSIHIGSDLCNGHGLVGNVTGFYSLLSNGRLKSSGDGNNMLEGFGVHFYSFYREAQDALKHKVFFNATLLQKGQLNI